MPRKRHLPQPSTTSDDCSDVQSSVQQGNLALCKNSETTSHFREKFVFDFLLSILLFFALDSLILCFGFFHSLLCFASILCFILMFQFFALLLILLILCFEEGSILCFDSDVAPVLILLPISLCLSVSLQHSSSSSRSRQQQQATASRVEVKPLASNWKRKQHACECFRYLD